MTKKILTKNNLKMSSYLMMKEMKNSAVKKLNYTMKRINKLLYAQYMLIKHLKKKWISLESSTDKKIIIGFWYAAIYIGKKSGETVFILAY